MSKYTFVIHATNAPMTARTDCVHCSRDRSWLRARSALYYSNNDVNGPGTGYSGYPGPCLS